MAKPVDYAYNQNVAAANALYQREKKAGFAPTYPVIIKTDRDRSFVSLYNEGVRRKTIFERSSDEPSLDVPKPTGAEKRANSRRASEAAYAKHLHAYLGGRKSG